MTLSSTTLPDAPPKRVVLVDFDWRDADLLPELLARPGLSVRLVAGVNGDAAGLKMAELCELPRTTDLADLTREIFDLAVVSERSPRRTQVEGLLLALGTPCVSPESLLRGPTSRTPARPRSRPRSPCTRSRSRAALGGEDFDALIEQALPDVGDVDARTTPPAVVPAGRSEVRVPSLEEFPSLEDRQGLERALADLVSGTGAQAAEVRAGRSGDVELLARVGDEDPLLKGLIDLALTQNAPQVISRLTGPQEGKAWGAWPFRTTRSRGVIAAAAIDPASGWTTWQQTVEDLRARLGPARPRAGRPGVPARAGRPARLARRRGLPHGDLARGRAEPARRAALRGAPLRPRRPARGARGRSAATCPPSCATPTGCSARSSASCCC